MPSSTRAVTLPYFPLDCWIPAHRSYGALTGHGVADCPKLTLFFKCTRRVSPQQWPIPGLLMSEPLFMFPYHCQMYAFKPGISSRCSSSDNNPVSTLAFSLSRSLRETETVVDVFCVLTYFVFFHLMLQTYYYSTSEYVVSIIIVDVFCIESELRIPVAY